MFAKTVVCIELISVWCLSLMLCYYNYSRHLQTYSCKVQWLEVGILEYWSRVQHLQGNDLDIDRVVIYLGGIR